MASVQSFFCQLSVGPVKSLARFAGAGRGIGSVFDPSTLVWFSQLSLAWFAGAGRGFKRDPGAPGQHAVSAEAACCPVPATTNQTSTCAVQCLPLLSSVVVQCTVLSSACHRQSQLYGGPVLATRRQTRSRRSRAKCGDCHLFNETTIPLYDYC